MYAKVEKPKENRGSAVANPITQKKNIGKQGFGFVDNRPEAVAQRNLQSIANGFTTQTVQRYTVEDNPAGKRSTNELMFVDNTNSLYATGEKVTAANGVAAASPISFESDDEDQKHGLSKVVVTKDEPVVEEDEVEAVEQPEHEDEFVEAEAEDEVIVGQEQIIAASDYVQDLLETNLESLKDLETSHQQQSAIMKKALGDDFIYAVMEFHGQGVEEVLRPALERFRAYLAGVGASDKILLPSDCGLFAGMIMNIQEKEVVDEEDGNYMIGLQQPDERVTVVEGDIATPGQANYVTGNMDEDQGVVYHWGATIMSDENDKVTMEGAVGLHADFPKLENDNTWKFEMYGTAEGEDTFASMNAHYFQDAEATESAVYRKTPPEED